MKFKTPALALLLLALASPALAQQVTPRALAVNVVITGGTPVTPVSGPTNGCYIFNFATAAEQGIVTAEPLLIDPVTTAGSSSGGTTIAIAPGAAWFCPPGSTLPVSVNAATSGHKIGGVRW
jgi:hypothetical protein